jgi:rhamnosyltransferase
MTPKDHDRYRFEEPPSTGEPAGPTVLIVPWFRGVRHVAPFIDGFEAQTIHADVRTIFIDSSPDDETTKKLRSRGYDTVRISPAEFDHGGTRNLGLRRANADGCEDVVFMTQDAYLEDPNSLATLRAELNSGLDMAMASGRHIPRADASRFERFLRGHRYPESIEGAGDQDGFVVSNTFCAYKVNTLMKIGGFEERLLFGEDSLASTRLRTQGFAVKYVPQATVRHSHSTTFSALFRRYFDMGAASRSASETSASLEQSGARQTLSRECRAVVQRRDVRLAVSWAWALLPRVLGYAIGRAARYVPVEVAARGSTSKAMFIKCNSAPRPPVPGSVTSSNDRA